MEIHPICSPITVKKPKNLMVVDKDIEKYYALVREIEATNNAWHAMQSMFENNFSITESSKFLKNRLQLRLLRNHSQNVYLEIDPDAEGEELYGIKLKIPVDNNTDAKHLPVKVVDDWLRRGLVSQKELESWLSTGQKG